MSQPANRSSCVVSYTLSRGSLWQEQWEFGDEGESLGEERIDAQGQTRAGLKVWVRASSDVEVALCPQVCVDCTCWRVKEHGEQRKTGGVHA